MFKKPEIDVIVYNTMIKIIVSNNDIKLLDKFLIDKKFKNFSTAKSYSVIEVYQDFNNYKTNSVIINNLRDEITNVFNYYIHDNIFPIEHRSDENNEFIDNSDDFIFSINKYNKDTNEENNKINNYVDLD